ncbi:MAG: transcriptional regulator [Thermoguttaceae bacterium]|nr:transcriptional regulator [Thermoguttaceae bacterium]
MKTFETIEKNIDVKFAKLPADVRNLLLKLAELPVEYRKELHPFVEDLIEGATRRREIFTLIQQAMSQVRLDMKYLIFDLEATRRERDANQIQ